MVYAEGILPPADPEAAALMEACLAEDPRPSYQEDAARIYHMRLGEYEASFTVCGETLTVVKIDRG